jgi:hypothetical protein
VLFIFTIDTLSAKADFVLKLGILKGIYVTACSSSSFDMISAQIKARNCQRKQCSTLSHLFLVL